MTAKTKNNSDGFNAIKPMAGKALALPVAALITGGLFLAMEGMISTDFEAQEKRDALTFEINPVVVDLPLPDDRDQPELVEVEVPPAPPVLDTVKTTKPVEPPIVLDDDFDIDLPEADIFTASVKIDRDPGPAI